MARTKQNSVQVEKAVNPMDQPDRFRLGEMGYSGISLFNGVTADEIQRELNWPYSASVYKEMTSHTCINACLNLYDNLISKVTWRVLPPEEATQEEKDQAKFINECLHDMDTPLRSVIRDALTSNVYGFAVLEKVYRRRYKSNGSLFNDGKVGLKKIALRNQETIQKFIYDENGNEILGVKQNVSSSTSPGWSGKKLEVNIPRNKFLHITTGRNRSDPFGKSPLRDVYLAWRYLTVIQEIEASGVARDLQGMPVLKLPAQYMAADASADQKALYENFKNIIRNIQNNSQSGVVLPSTVDPETRQAMFSLELLSTEGGKKSFDTTEVKQYYQNQIFTALHSDVLILGQGGVGSFAMGQIKNSLTGTAVEAMLDNIVDEFNRDVIRQLYELNGWEISRAARLDYEGLNAMDLETLSKAYQRLASTSMIEKDREVLNAVRKSLGVDPRPDDDPVDESLITPDTSRSGDGMQVGRTGNGTATTVTGEDTSSNNLENTA